MIIHKEKLIRPKKGSNKDRFYALFNFFSMSFVSGQELTKNKHVCHLENSIPDDKLLPTNFGPKHLPTSERVLKRFYASKGKCALWVFPYHCIQFKDSLKGNVTSEDQLNDSPDLSSGRGMKNQPRYRSWPRGLISVPKYSKNNVSVSRRPTFLKVVSEREQLLLNLRTGE